MDKNFKHSIIVDENKKLNLFYIAAEQNTTCSIDVFDAKNNLIYTSEVSSLRVNSINDIDVISSIPVTVDIPINSRATINYYFDGVNFKASCFIRTSYSSSNSYFLSVSTPYKLELQQRRSFERFFIPDNFFTTVDLDQNEISLIEIPISEISEAGFSIITDNIEQFTLGHIYLDAFISFPMVFTKCEISDCVSVEIKHISKITSNLFKVGFMFKSYTPKFNQSLNSFLMTLSKSQ